MRARRGGLKRAAFWRSTGWANLKRATAERKRKAAERRALGLVSPDYAKRLRRKGIPVGDAATARPEPAPKPASDSAALVEQPRRPRIVVDVSARGLTLAQVRAR
jgi:hypothetical protein